MIRPISVGAEGTVMTVIAVLARAHVRQHRQSGRIPPPNAGRPDAVTDQPPVTISCQGTPSTRTAAPRGRRSNRCENNGKGFPAGGLLSSGRARRRSRRADGTARHSAHP